jgi:Beta-1,3-glucanase
MRHSLLAAIAFAGLAWQCGGSSGPQSVVSEAGSPTPEAGAHDAGGIHDAGRDSSSSSSGGHEGGPPDAAPEASSSSSSGGTIDSGAGVLVKVTNGCPFDLWIHATAMEGTLQPDNAHLVQGTSQSYQAPLTWTSGRVYGYFDAPDVDGNPQGENDKVEATFSNSNGSEALNTDLTYVDWVALPSQIQTFGTGSDCTTVGCEVPYASLLAGCPSSLLTTHACLSAGYYCLTGTNPNDPFCHALDAQIASCASEYPDCAAASGSTTTDVYSCSGSFFGGSPEYCAALNRNVLSAPAASTPASSFYQAAPFNTYAQWVHGKCPGIYAFPYDDWGSSNQSSDHTCQGATELDVTFCPKG